MSDHNEQEIFPGVYLTDFRRKNTDASPSVAAAFDINQVSVLDLHELQNKMFHLKRSNEEMKEFDPEGKDPEIQEFIQENIVLLAEYEQQEKLIKLQLEMVSRHQVQ